MTTTLPAPSLVRLFARWCSQLQLLTPVCCSGRKLAALAVVQCRHIAGCRPWYSTSLLWRLLLTWTNGTLGAAGFLLLLRGRKCVCHRCHCSCDQDTAGELVEHDDMKPALNHVRLTRRDAILQQASTRGRAMPTATANATSEWPWMHSSLDCTSR